MGYDASFDALITVSKSVDKEAIIERIKDAFDIPEVWTDDKTESSFDLWFGEYAKYDEDSIYTFLAEIEPYTISGEITYTGEDASNWRHVFDSETHQWMEQEGYVAYREDGKTIHESMAFLEELAKQTRELLSAGTSEPER
jgi:hypothetical protein